jgi:UDP-GlcNAc:undecaprenyl-phosphate GlcNAc-1-phosphate transferase
MDMFYPAPGYFFCLIAFVGAFLLTVVSIPKIIYIAKRKRLFDVPDNQRKVHTRTTPSLGGIAIFFSFMVFTAICIEPGALKWSYFAAAALILFGTGVRDDLVNLPPLKKLMAQIAAAVIVVWLADIRLTSLYGFLGIYELPWILSFGFSVIGCVFITNAFNLIDGIDGLAGAIGVLASGLFGVLLYMQGEHNGAIMAFSLMGAILGFLRYNISPARIFMGDTGSMVIGFSISVLAVLFVRGYEAHPQSGLTGWIDAPTDTLIVTLSILFIPVFDTLRVFTTRSLKGRSPFRADRTHLHHYLLDLGFSHNRTVLLLVMANILIIATSFLVRGYDLHLAVACLFFVAFGLFTIMYYLRRRAAARAAHAVLVAQQMPAAGTPEVAEGYNGAIAPASANPAQRVWKKETITLKGKKIAVGEG